MKFKKVCSVLLVTTGILGLSAYNVYSSELEYENLITPETEEEILGTKEKLNDMEKYIKAKSMLKSYDGKKVLRNYRIMRQKNGPYCGPTAAYNASNGKFSVETFAKMLNTRFPKGGTSFPGKWVYTMNEATDHGNNYQILRGKNYGFTDWRAKIKNSVIYTIDKGYPLIADCYIKKERDRLHPNYSYATDTTHYVAIVGYDDLPQTVPAKVLIIDSNSRKNSNGGFLIPGEYWSELNNVTYATKEFGIVW
ncbi:C39 family peptidase [Clostridium perfringens]|uniref:C39 family peptidase n=1 Tax=Clostridium perfringens TaxID=1502 RepID=UPI0024BC4AB4|nr:C39 family peptidase [Clostridium perfringens]ELC8333234.1 C39 family peptidase [Clostridium perfringens]MDT7989037.1 C39 family peptidase [Clostridium perfringens]